MPPFITIAGYGTTSPSNSRCVSCRQETSIQFELFLLGFSLLSCSCVLQLSKIHRLMHEQKLNVWSRAATCWNPYSLHIARLDISKMPSESTRFLCRFWIFMILQHTDRTWAMGMPLLRMPIFDSKRSDFWNLQTKACVCYSQHQRVSSKFPSQPTELRPVDPNCLDWTLRTRRSYSAIARGV